jgi:hypothetical protein
VGDGEAPELSAAAVRVENIERERNDTQRRATPINEGHMDARSRARHTDGRGGRAHGAVFARPIVPKSPANEYRCDAPLHSARTGGGPARNGRETGWHPLGVVPPLHANGRDPEVRGHQSIRSIRPEVSRSFKGGVGVDNGLDPVYSLFGPIAITTGTVTDVARRPSRIPVWSSRLARARNGGRPVRTGRPDRGWCLQCGDASSPPSGSLS